jgi:hypothetical protein
MKHSGGRQEAVLTARFVCSDTSARWFLTTRLAVGALRLLSETCHCLRSLYSNIGISAHVTCPPPPRHAFRRGSTPASGGPEPMFGQWSVSYVCSYIKRGIFDVSAKSPRENRVT